ncbi:MULTISPECIES: hypothetical protein [unclassified Streptomyces]|uniref:hypothetical protein n=1 Tax=unclassified Streptomyces TaxID=2593676 RepID=UPI001660D021|nr:MULTISPECIES: hypothetical protein [unclassified Streptomyces]MBD0707371.1 hypothetical protein [Streptomyces sp. CBMA291]MBD0715177.1 hypothetical protein [Streptomyces sp. CBMA370]
MSIPTPADLARLAPRPRPLPPSPSARSATPEEPAGAADGPFRALWERGITGSTLHPNAKLVGYTVAAGADWDTGQLADPRPPVRRLAGRCALTQGQVVTSLNHLEARGWISRPDARVRWGTTEITLTIPAPILRHLRRKVARPDTA